MVMNNSTRTSLWTQIAFHKISSHSLSINFKPLDDITVMHVIVVHIFIACTVTITIVMHVLQDNNRLLFPAFIIVLHYQ